MFGLGGKVFEINGHIDIGDLLARGCAWAYSQFPTGLIPEIFSLTPCASLNEWQGKGDPTRDPRYQLRPEAIESIFLLYRITGKEDLRDLAWQMFQSLIKSTRTSIAYGAIRDVTVSNAPEQDDSMEVSYQTLCCPSLLSTSGCLHYTTNFLAF